MVEPKTFKGFFSYARDDLKGAPGMISLFVTALENCVNAKLTNARFDIWFDKAALSTGDQWNTKIDSELRQSDVLIVFLSPSWIESDFCRKEYLIFEEIEAEREVGAYVAPILIRTIEKQEQHFTDEQRRVYDRIRHRQITTISAIEFLRLSDGERLVLLDRIADDVEGMIERRREPIVANERISNRRVRRTDKAREFDPRAHDFEEYDIVAGAEVFIDQRRGEELRNIYAQVDFTERLYVAHGNARIEFGVQRAYWLFRNNGPGRLAQADDLRSKIGRGNAYYLTRLDEPETVVLCMQPDSGRLGLAELALPPSANENRLAKVAMATPVVEPTQLTSRLEVALGSEGLWVTSEKDQPMTHASSQWIEAIMTVAAKRDITVRETGRLSREIPIEER